MADWGGGFNGEITIVNNSATALADWQVEFDWDRSLDAIWNAKLVRRSESRWVLGPDTWNGTIAPGARVTIGFSGTPGGVSDGPVNLTVNGASITPPAAPASVRLSWLPTSQSETGFTASLVVENTGNTAVEGWTLAFDYDAAITSVWNAGFERQGRRYTLSSGEESRSIPPAGAVVVGLTADGTAPGLPVNCTFNGAACQIVAAGSLGSGGGATEPAPVPVPAPSVPPAVRPGAITISSVDDAGEAMQLTVSQGDTEFRLSARVADPRFTVLSSNPAVVTAAMRDGNVLVLTARASGRAALRIVEAGSYTARYVGVRVRRADGALPGLPGHLAIGSVSEDTAEHLNFWRGFGEGLKNRRVDYRYIYLNGGPNQGWATWSAVPGGRAIEFIRNSRMLGMVPFLVFYNIPENSESFTVAVTNTRRPDYMAAYFRNLQLLLDIIARESPDEPVGIVLEPDFLGYLAQALRLGPAQIPAATSGAYDAGVLLRGLDPAFPDTITGLVGAMNYLISSRCPQCYFGWQMNLWASPAGGWTTAIPAKGIVRLTDGAADWTEARGRIRAEAAAIASFYAAAGVATHGARFFSIDKYGLDAVGFEPAAAANPASSTWFWNSDHWSNYLLFVQSARERLGLPAVLWQLPVGRVNGSQEENPYAPGSRFPDLTNVPGRYEDSAPTWFFGDRFTAPGPRAAYFAENRAGDPSLATGAGDVQWGAHFADAARAGVVAALFGAGVPNSTANVGDPPSDGYWWITKAQRYLTNPAPASGR